MRRSGIPILAASLLSGASAPEQANPPQFDLEACLDEIDLPSPKTWPNPPDRLRWQKDLWRKRIRLRRQADRMLKDHKLLAREVKSDPARSETALKSREVQALRQLLDDPEFTRVLKTFNQTIEPVLSGYMDKQRDFVDREIDRRIYHGVAPRALEPSGPLLAPFISTYRPEWDALKQALTVHHGKVQTMAREALRTTPGPVATLAVLALYEQELSLVRVAAFVHDALYVGP